MERQFGDSTWDIYANHKGDWCLYESHTCQIKTGCVNCDSPPCIVISFKCMV
jgi:hypothetical protein